MSVAADILRGRNSKTIYMIQLKKRVDYQNSSVSICVIPPKPDPNEPKLRKRGHNCPGNDETRRARGLRGIKFGPANLGRVLTGAEFQEAVIRLKAEGHLDSNRPA